jgi:protein-histidine N-methyltransferase
MSSSFSFGFAGDDIHIDAYETEQLHDNEHKSYSGQNHGITALPQLVPAQQHTLEELV